MTNIVIKEVPECLGVPEELTSLFVGLRVSLSELQKIGWLGYSVPPTNFYSYNSLLIPVLDLGRTGYVISIADMITACEEAGGRQALLAWLIQLRKSDYCLEYFLVACDWCEYKP